MLVKKAEAHDKTSIIKNVAIKEVIAENGKVVAVAYEDRVTAKKTNSLRYFCVNSILV